MIPHVQTVQNIFGKGGYSVFKVELRPAEVDPYFKRKNSWSNENLTATIYKMRPPQRHFDVYKNSLIQYRSFILKIVAVRFFVIPP